MKVFVYGPWGRLPVVVDNLEQLKKKISDKLKVNEFSLFLDPEKNEELREQQLKDKQQIYVSETTFTREDLTANHCSSVNLDKNDYDGNRTKAGSFKYLSHAEYIEVLRERNEKYPDFTYSFHPCSEHSANQRCFKCMPKTIKLKAQIYRMTDYVEFDNKDLTENFIDRWNKTRRQQFGLLIGRRKTVGTKSHVVVSAIWHINQENYPDGFHIQNLSSCAELCGSFEPLSVVGFVYTDLFVRDGKFYSFKLDNNYIVSAVELLFFYKAAMALGLPPHEMINICIGLDSEGNVSPTNFMVTEQFCGLCQAGHILLSSDPTVFIHNDQEIQYSYTNEYEKVVSAKADPYVPVEYFVVKSEVGFNHLPLFPSTGDLGSSTFPTEDRLAAYFQQRDHFHDFELYKNFDLLLLLCHSVPSLFPGFFTAVVNNDIVSFNKIVSSDDFTALINSTIGHMRNAWTCKACTLINKPNSDRCEVCETKKD